MSIFYIVFDLHFSFITIHLYFSLYIYMHSDIFYKNGERGVEKATGW